MFKLHGDWTYKQLIVNCYEICEKNKKKINKLWTIKNCFYPFANWLKNLSWDKNKGERKSFLKNFIHNVFWFNKFEFSDGFLKLKIL